MSALCLAGGAELVRVAATVFTLAWTHTIEKVPWQEDWRIEDRQLRLVEVRIKGSGAGMEPAPDARLENGFYTWNPADDRRDRLVLRRSPAPGVGDWSLCVGGACRALGDIVGPDVDPVTLAPCPD